MTETGFAGLAAPVAGRSRFVRETVLSLAVSGAALALDYSLLVGLTKFAGVNYLLSAAAGFLAGLLLNYILSVEFVFHERRFAGRWVEFWGFAAIGILGLALNEGLMKAFVENAGLNYAVAKLPTAALCFLFNYGVRRAVLFTNPMPANGVAVHPVSQSRLGAWRNCAQETLKRGIEGVWLGGTIAVLTIVCVWAVCRPYAGIVHDARIYAGRALADLDPAGIGTQLSYLYDGQSAFSIFPFMMRTAVHGFGAGPAALLLTAIGLACWIAAAAFLLSRFARGKLFWACMICLAALPHGYGGFGIFEWAEPFATPRIFAEAAGIASLAFLLDGRKLAAFALLLLAAAFHPLMALAVGGVGMCLLIVEDRRWFAAVGLLFVIVALAAALRLPLLQRLTAGFDPAWMKVLAARSPYLFPALWTAKDWALLLTQLLTVGIAASLVEAKLRRLLLAAAAVAATGIAVTMLFPSVLIVQIQPWRAQWLASMLAVAGLPIAATFLWRRGDTGRTCLAMLIVTWLCRDSLLAAVLCGTIAIGLRFFPQRWRLHRLALPAAWWVTAGIAAAAVAIKCYVLFVVLRSLPFSSYWLVLLSRSDIQTVLFPAVALVLLLGPVRWSGAGRAIAGLASLAAAMFLLAIWDARSAFVRMAEDGVDARSLHQMLPAGNVLWLGSDGTAPLKTLRPDWWSPVQGAGAVFNRQLAIGWKSRFEALLAARLVSFRQQLILENPPPARPLIQTSDTGLAAICGKNSHLDWIVAPIAQVDGGIIPQVAAHAERIWTAPAAKYSFDTQSRRWVAVRRYAVFSCAEFASKGEGRS